eukprot:scaffold13128_cov105-Cylindrotheca_fusiformis.AAC.1
MNSTAHNENKEGHWGEVLLLNDDPSLGGCITITSRSKASCLAESTSRHKGIQRIINETKLPNYSNWEFGTNLVTTCRSRSRRDEVHAPLVLIGANSARSVRYSRVIYNDN